MAKDKPKSLAYLILEDGRFAPSFLMNGHFMKWSSIQPLTRRDLPHTAYYRPKIIDLSKQQVAVLESELPQEMRDDPAQYRKCSFPI